MEYVREEGERQLQKLTSDQPVRTAGVPRALPRRQH
jgi:hypothetical protein